jgi:hypothetical protein
MIDEQKELTVEEQTQLLRQHLQETKQQLVQALTTNQQLQILNEVMTEQRQALMDQTTELMVAIKTNNHVSKSNENHASATHKALQDTVKALSDTNAKINGIAEEAKLKFRCCGWYVEFITRLPVRFLEYVPWLHDIESIVSYYQAIKVRDQRLLSQNWLELKEDKLKFAESVFKDLMPIYANSEKALPLIEFFSDKHNEHEAYVEQLEAKAAKRPSRRTKGVKTETLVENEESDDGATQLLSDIDKALNNSKTGTDLSNQNL